MAQKHSKSPKKPAPKPSATAAASTAAAAPLLDFEQLFQNGNSAAARRRALQVLSLDGDAAVKERAQATLNQVKLDLPSAAVWGGLLLVLGGVFFNAIVTRNAQLGEQAHVSVGNKTLQLAPPQDSVHVEEDRGAP